MRHCLLDIVAALLEVLSIQLQASAPFNQCDAMILVGIARLQERRNAMLQADQRCAYGEQLVAGHRAIGVAIQVTPFPYSCVGPAARVVGLGLQLHLHVVFGQLVALGQIAHHVEQPVAHATREVFQILAVANARLVAGAIVVDVQMRIVWMTAARILDVAPATLLVDGAVRGPGLVLVGAHMTTHIRLLGALGNAHALWLALVQLANATGAAVHDLARINLDNWIQYVMLHLRQFLGQLILTVHIFVLTECNQLIIQGVHI